MSKLNYVITDNNITVNYDGQTHIIPRSSSLADQLIEALRNRQADKIPDLVSVSKRIETFGKGDFEVRDGQVLVKGRVVPELLAQRILKFANDGLPHEPLVKFAENLLKNPSYRAVQGLFQFLEKNNHPLTENGCFIAFKKVRSDFKDAYTGTMDNSPGKLVEMPRNEVDEDPEHECAKGLHVANWDYSANHYSAGDDPVMLEVEVNPEHVVAVPRDYNGSKMRVCAYVVLGAVDVPHSEDMSLRRTQMEEPLIQSEDDECPDCHEYALFEGECAACGYDEEDICSECGEHSCEGECQKTEDEVCPECGRRDCEYEYCLTKNQDELGHVCSECGCVMDDDSYDLCVDCDNLLNEEPVSTTSPPNVCDGDRYPWEDDLEEE
jgi:hypothetical protein